MDARNDFERWQFAIGKLIFSCARVEYEILKLYNKWLPKRDFHKDKFKQKYDVTIGIVKSKFGKEHELVMQLIEMKSYASIRHVVAHTPVHYSHEYYDWRFFDLKSNLISFNILELEKISKKAELDSIILSMNLRVNLKRLE